MRSTVKKTTLQKGENKVGHKIVTRTESEKGKTALSLNYKIATQIESQMLQITSITWWQLTLIHKPRANTVGRSKYIPR